ncbi:MAG TPA: hypothetical protein VF163_06855 [Micromonosporaceae bacterium]
MRFLRSLLLVCVVAVALASCSAGGTTAAPPAGFAGAPALPDTFTVADWNATAALPEVGPVGRATLMYRATSGLFLLLADGRQYRLPRPPRAEGRQGSMRATISPDGHWLGHRTARLAMDPRYVFRELTGSRRIETSGTPVLWSADGHRVLMAVDNDRASQLTMVDLVAGRTGPAGFTRFQDNLWLAGLLPDGRPMFAGFADGGLRMRIGERGHTMPFHSNPDHACWCPNLPLGLSPDGARLALRLAHASGLDPVTGEKVRVMPDEPNQIITLDLSTDAIRHRVSLPVRDESDQWRLLSHTGAGVLLQHSVNGQVSLVLVDAASGEQLRTCQPPAGVFELFVPGEVEHGTDG